MPQYWYNMITHDVEEGAQSDWSRLLGPYETREEAGRALEKVQQRNNHWEEADEN